MSEINPTSFFNLDAASADASVNVPEEDNVFAELEQTLQLPIGSTKDAIAASKDAIARTKNLVVQADMVTFKEQSIDNRDAEDIDDELLKAERAKIRKEAHELYDMQKNLLNYMYEQLKGQIDPSDKQWAACASMCAAVTKSLADLNKMTKEFREENDRYIEKKVQSGELDVNEQEFDFSPEQANKIIASWTKQNEANILDQIKNEVEERQMNRIGVETKQIENKADE
jgi:hypothetical protein